MRVLNMAKKKSVEDRFFPVATVPRLNRPSKPAENQMVIKSIIQWTVQGAYQIKTPSAYDLKYSNLPKTLADKDQIDLVVHLIESLQPRDAIEATLASQYVISYIRGIEDSINDEDGDYARNWFEFGHQVLETLIKFRTQGAQLINVQYNHNQGQINNYKIVEKDNSQPTIEVN